MGEVWGLPGQPGLPKGAGESNPNHRFIQKKYPVFIASVLLVV